jgi:hypothetical protein
MMKSEPIKTIYEALPDDVKRKVSLHDLKRVSDALLKSEMASDLVLMREATAALNGVGTRFKTTLEACRANAIAIQKLAWGHDGDCGADRLAATIEEDCDKALFPSRYSKHFDGFVPKEFLPLPELPKGYQHWEYRGLDWRCDEGPACTFANCAETGKPEWDIHENTWPEGMGHYLQAMPAPVPPSTA